jgi:hypothetical protein
MRSNEAREVMVERVNAAYAKWPSFEALPETTGDTLSPVNEAALRHDPSGYVKALYAAAYRGEIIGRRGMSIAVRKVTESAI